MPRCFSLPAALALCLSATALAAQQADSSLLTLDRIFDSAEFAPERLGPVRWIEDEPAYPKLEPDSAAPGGAVDIVRYDAATGRRDVMVPAAPPGAPPATRAARHRGLRAGRADGKQLLIFTNSGRSGAQNTRGDYWVLDLATGALQKLGGRTPRRRRSCSPSSRPTAAGSATCARTTSTSSASPTGGSPGSPPDGSRTIINGTFDWVYEEEFDLRDGFRWSPDGAADRLLAARHAPASRDFRLINNTDSLYSFVIPIQYPKAGTTNSAARVGVVSAGGGPTRWLDVPGDPRNNYIARHGVGRPARTRSCCSGSTGSRTPIEVMLADAATGARAHRAHRARQRLGRRGGRPALARRRQELHLGQRARRLAPPVPRLARRDDGTAGDAGRFDVHSPQRLRRAATSTAWTGRAAGSTTWPRPTTPTQRYLYRARLDGKGSPERVTPAGPAGVPTTTRSRPTRRWAFHTYSTFGVPPVIDLVRLPDHEVVRTLVDERRAQRTPWPRLQPRASGVLPGGRRATASRSTAG